MEDDLEAAVLHRSLPLVVVPQAPKARDLPGLVEKLPVVWVALVIAIQHDPVQDGHLRPRLEHTTDLLEDRAEILGVRHGLHLVEGIKVRVREGQGVVHVGLLEGQLPILLEACLLRVLVRDCQLGRVDVDPDDLRPGPRRDVVGDAPAAAADLQSHLARADVQLVCKSLLEKQLILEHAHGRIDDGRDVHLLDTAKRAEAVQDSVVVLHLLIVLITVYVEGAGIPLEDLKGFDEAVQLLRRDGVQRGEGLVALLDPVAQPLHAAGPQERGRGHRRDRKATSGQRDAPHDARRLLWTGSLCEPKRPT
mmetsp:Transcript_39480/g.94558  ORF Transcript_39480/g.94558 Transcript_39480/m.94558 type:complete len:307 (+) Transcript_39480:376-1296(+)